ncbi:hypothetical protein OIU84_019266 [Salix udensis]|uniref:Uncharacterized protein n=1 Tax=Salix udensis TaxID=889485 RepID=A0AAD6PIU2_9ROSI|nr:hypothetical protein OIU84_019266 [Salix udensis]
MGSDSETERSNIKVKTKITALAPISKPSAGKKLCKQTLKLVRKVYLASESKCLKERSERSGQEHSSRPLRIMHNSRDTFLQLMSLLML